MQPRSLGAQPPARSCRVRGRPSVAGRRGACPRRAECGRDEAGEGLLARDAPAPRPRLRASGRSRGARTRRAGEWSRSRRGQMLRDFLRSLAAEGRTILVSSHVLAEVAQTVDRVVIIHRGTLVQQSSIAEILAGGQGATRVRSPDAVRLRELLARQAPSSLRSTSGRLRPVSPPSGSARSQPQTASSSTSSRSRARRNVRLSRSTRRTASTRNWRLYLLLSRRLFP